MKIAFLPSLALVLALPAAAQDGPPDLSLEQRMLLRCSAAFAIVANGQEAGEEAALAFPPLAERGREFFIRSAAEVMDSAGLDRERLSAAMAEEARLLVEENTLAEVMPVCLNVLDNSGL